jgi:hypothetical protein
MRAVGQRIRVGWMPRQWNCSEVVAEDARSNVHSSMDAKYIKLA